MWKILFLLLGACSYPKEVFHFQQEMEKWCWAATAQTAILYSTGQYFEQCQIADFEFGFSTSCCKNPDDCNIAISVVDLYKLLVKFNVDVTGKWDEPNWDNIAKQLKKAIILTGFCRQQPDPPENLLQPFYPYREEGKTCHVVVISDYQKDILTVLDPALNTEPLHIPVERLKEIYGDWAFTFVIN